MIVPLESSHAVESTVSVLREGKPVIAPGDTIYGILGMVPEAEDAVREMKGREEHKPFLQLILKTWIHDLSSQSVDNAVLDCWPGALTVIVRNHHGGTTAYRAPDDDFLQEVLRKLQRPLFSTSVNRAGEPPMNSIDEIIEAFKDTAELIIDGGELVDKAPSTLLDITSRPWKVLRQGACKVPNG